MATQTATRAASSFPVAGGVGNAQSLKVAHGTVTLSANPAPGEILEMCKVPKGAVVVGGWLRGDAVESTATAGGLTLNLQIGDSDDPDRFLSPTVVNPLPVVGIKPETGYNIPLGGLLISAGPQTMTSEKTIRVTVTASATNFVTGAQLFLDVHYYVP